MKPSPNGKAPLNVRVVTVPVPHDPGPSASWFLAELLAEIYGPPTPAMLDAMWRRIEARIGANGRASSLGDSHRRVPIGTPNEKAVPVG